MLILLIDEQGNEYERTSAFKNKYKNFIKFLIILEEINILH